MQLLNIHHNIHLTKAERYALHNGRDVQTVGVTSSVLIGKTSDEEITKEVFCLYILQNIKINIPIRITESGYRINIPNCNVRELEISNEKYWKMTQDEQEIYNKMKGTQASSKNLLDIEDGGSKSLVYREHSKVQHNGQEIQIIHFVCIEDMDQLLNSLADPAELDFMSEV